MLKPSELKQVEKIEKYLALKGQAEEIEARLKEMRDAMAKKVKVGTTVTFGDYQLSHIEVTRENFQLKAARLLMPAELLAPFVTLSVYTQLRVK